MIPASMIAARSYPPWLSDVGNWVVVLFGLLLWVSCLITLLCVGMRGIFGKQSKCPKHEKVSRRA